LGRVCALLLLMLAPVAISAPGDLLFERKGGAAIEAFPPTLFPHWVHRINYRCDACHDSLFEMRQGSTEVSMAMINRGEACGTCHNGDTAFSASFENCARCHRKPD